MSIMSNFKKRPRSLNREMTRMKREQQASIAVRLSKVSQAFIEGDEEAVSRYSTEAMQYINIVTQATAGLAFLEQFNKQGWGPPAPEADSQAADKMGTRPPETDPLTDVPHYCMSSSTAATLYAYLKQTLPDAPDSEPEWMVAATGVRRENVRTLEQLMYVKMAKQTVTRAAFDMKHFSHIARALDKHGQALYGIFHSHRFAGQVTPSHVDWELQRKLDSAGYPCIQAVFSEDGYFRFFANKPFSVDIFGKGVNRDKHQEKLFRVTETATLSDVSSHGDERGHA